MKVPILDELIDEYVEAFTSCTICYNCSQEGKLHKLVWRDIADEETKLVKAKEQLASEHSMAAGLGSFGDNSLRYKRLVLECPDRPGECYENTRL